MMVGDIFMEGWPHRGLSIYICTIVSDMKNVMSFEENCIISITRYFQVLTYEIVSIVI